MDIRLRRTASALALAAALLLLIADSPAPECTFYEPIDVQYSFETDCPGSSASGIVSFQVLAAEASVEAETESILVEQAAAAGLYLESAYVDWDHLDCLGASEDGIANARRFNFTLVPGDTLATAETSPQLGGDYECDYWEGELESDQTLTCTSYWQGRESRTCTLNLTHVD